MAKAEGGSKTDTAVKLVLIFFISLLSFSVGTYVGKQVSDSDFHRAALEVDYKQGAGEAAAEGGEKAEATEHTAEHAEGKAGAAEEASTKPITEEEVSNLADEFIKKEGRTPAAVEGAEKHEGGKEVTEHAAEKHEEKAAEGYTHRSKDKAATTEAMHDKMVEAAHRVANDKAPAPEAKPVAKAAAAVLPTVATSTVGKYTVQVASFATEAEAKERASSLTEKGYNAFFVQAQIGGKTWYRVSVGLFSDQKSASNYRTELLATQAVSTAIVQKIVK
jgi:cell division protein FtsN